MDVAKYLVKLLCCPMEILHCDSMAWRNILWAHIKLNFYTADLPTLTVLPKSFCIILSPFEWLHLSEKLLEQLSPGTSTVYLSSNGRSGMVFVFNQAYFQGDKKLLISRSC